MAGSVKDKTLSDLKAFSESEDLTKKKKPAVETVEVICNINPDGSLDDEKLLVFYDEQNIDDIGISPDELVEMTQEIYIDAYYLLEKDPKKYSCRFENFIEQELCVLTFHENVSVGDHIEINLSFEYGKNAAKIKISGNVRESHQVESSQYVNIDIPKESVDFFEGFLNLNRMRQKNVTAFLRLAKGA